MAEKIYVLSSSESTYQGDSSSNTDDEQESQHSQQSRSSKEKKTQIEGCDDELIEDESDEDSQEFEGSADWDNIQNSPSDTNTRKTCKKCLMFNGNEQSDENMSKVIFKWGEKDEIILLNQIVDYKAKTGDDVSSRMNVFYKYVKDSLGVTLTKSQVYEKIRRLKKKFETNAEKQQNGEQPVFSRPHESKLFELSQKIWGSEGISKRKGVKDTLMVDKKEKTLDFWSSYPFLCASLEKEAPGSLTPRLRDLKEYVKKIISRIGEEKARELEDEWEAFHVMEHQLYVKKTHLIKEQARAGLDCLKNFYS